MHFTTTDRKEHLKHGLRYDPFKAIVTPRPIGWITSVSAEGVLNLAPYSFFNAVSDQPKMVMFSTNGKKDSLRNIEATGEFTCSVVGEPLAAAMNLSSATVNGDVSEYDLTGLATAPSLVVRPPRVAAAPAALECRLWQVLELPRGPDDPTHYVVFGTVVAMFLDDRVVNDGRLDTAAMRPVARLGYMDYAVVTPETVFTLDRPRVAADGRTLLDTRPGSAPPATVTPPREA